MNLMENLYLVDGHAVVYRYHFAFAENPLRNTKGEITSGVFGMAKIVGTLLKNYPMSHIAVIFDPPCRTWRKDFYPEYKANRKHADDISPQLLLTYHMLKTWGIYTEAFKPFEADDVIATLAKQGEAAGLGVRIVTKDKDFAQLVNDNINMLDLGKSVGKDDATILDRNAVKERFKVFPEQIVDYLALMGDKADNIPGLGGIGKKGASDLLTEFGSIENIYANIDNLAKTKKARETKKAKFENARDTIKRDIKLVKLVTDINLPLQLDELKKPPLHNASLFELLNELECFSIIKILSED